MIRVGLPFPHSPTVNLQLPSLSIIRKHHTGKCGYCGEAKTTDHVLLHCQKCDADSSVGIPLFGLPHWSTVGHVGMPTVSPRSPMVACLLSFWPLFYLIIQDQKIGTTFCTCSHELCGKWTGVLCCQVEDACEVSTF